MPTYYRRPQKPTAQTASPRKKVTWIVLAGVLVLLAAIGVFCWVLTRDPEPDLPPEQKIRRNFQRAFDPEESTLERLASLRRSFHSAQNIPPEKRNSVIIEALAESVNRTFTEFAQLPPDRKEEQAERMREDAERTLQYFRSFPREKQKMALAILADTPGGRAQIDQAIDTTTNKFSPEDRRLLGPTIKIWKSMLENRK
ncbi:MAG: hypothetical protein MR051_05470 [Lentisphaeria bacterium]|nr:hypothetical protein [Lentisphaeria bacterium]